MQQQQHEIDEITAKNRSGPNDPELNQLVMQLREKLSLLVARASQGITLINVRFQFFIQMQQILIQYFILSSYAGRNPKSTSTQSRN